VKLALNYEIQRQSRMITTGQIVTLETRLYDDAKGVTESMRNKEEALDYRYFPEPDLPPFTPDQKFLEAIEASVIELPIPRKKRYMAIYGFTADQADFLTEEKKRADYFDQVVAAGCDAIAAINWLKGDVTKLLNRDGKNLEDSALSVARFISLLKLLAEGAIHGKIGKQVLEAVFDEDKDPEIIIKERNLTQMGGGEELEKIIEKVLNDNASVVNEIRSGNPKPKGFLVGQIMKTTGGSADPAAVQAILSKKLGV
jgi:aspartyl-tRNA(Asn)/glutamyl-tRNA(Gln) amidotransferase subunit B